jgi:hypothetical protein
MFFRYLSLSANLQLSVPASHQPLYLVAKKRMAGQRSSEMAGGGEYKVNSGFLHHFPFSLLFYTVQESDTILKQDYIFTTYE